MLNLVECIVIDVRISDSVEQGEKCHIGEDLSDDRPHLDLLQPSLTSVRQFSSIETMRTVCFGSMSKGRFILTENSCLQVLKVDDYEL